MVKQVFKCKCCNGAGFVDSVSAELSELDILAEKLFISAFGDPRFNSGWTTSVAEFCYETAQKFLEHRESRKQK